MTGPPDYFQKFTYNAGMTTCLRNARRERKWAQGQLAERAGVSVSVVSYLENGYRPPHAATREAVAAAFGLSVGALFPEQEGAHSTRVGLTTTEVPPATTRGRSIHE